MQTVRRGTTVSVLADGPRGPARRSKQGVVSLSRNVDVAIVPVALSSSSAFAFDSWDGTLLPPPFARVVCAFGEPLCVSPGDDEEEQRRELDRRLNELTNEADRSTGFVDRRRPTD